MDLLTRETAETTPRQALVEMYQMRGGVARCPKWFEKRLDAIGNYLSRVKFKGRPILDERMSMTSIDAVLKEAWHAVNTPEYRQQEFERVAGEANASRGIH
jgi:hypothetical protein